MDGGCLQWQGAGGNDRETGLRRGKRGLKRSEICSLSKAEYPMQ